MVKIQNIVTFFYPKKSFLTNTPERRSHLSANVNRDADDHGGHGDAGDEGDANRSSDQSSQLPQDLLLPAPRLLSPERAAGWTERGRREGSGGDKCGGENAREPADWQISSNT